MLGDVALTSPTPALWIHYFKSSMMPYATSSLFNNAS